MSKFTVDSDGALIWKNSKGEFHRKKGPAIIWPDGHKEWYIKGELHRKKGPAIICADGRKYWFIHGRRIKTIKT